MRKVTLTLAIALLFAGSAVLTADVSSLLVMDMRRRGRRTWWPRHRAIG